MERESLVLIPAFSNGGTWVTSDLDLGFQLRSKMEVPPVSLEVQI